MPSPSRAAAALTASALLVLGCAASADDSASPETSGDEVALFDSSVVHEISVEFDTDDYDELIETFAETNEKIWIEATVTIDGVVFEHAGMRLKGNSSLAGLGGGPGGGQGGPPGGGDFGGLGGASADSPEGLPWLIRLDEFVEGQTYQGYEDIVVRSNGSATALNEAVALDLLEEAGLASQEAVSTTFAVNGGDPILRLAIEHPDDDAWQDRVFGEDGALYKAESTGNWSYRGDDPDDYTEVFDQEGGSDLTDLTPLIDFLQFLNESSDEDFAAQLADRLDVEAFAEYLAMMDLLGNFDDIDGPGNNAYLWYDIDAEQFTVVAWDLNLAFGAIGGPGGFGDGGPGAGFELPEGVEVPEGFDPANPPEGFEIPEGIELPEGFDPENLPEGFPGGGGPGGPAGGFGGGGNILVERFHANEEFEALYQTAFEDLRATLYDSGVALDILDRWTETLNADAGDLVDTDMVTEESDAIAEQFASED